MSLKSALLSGLAAIVLIVLLGNPLVVDWAQDQGGTASFTIRSVTSTFTWDFGEIPSEMRGSAAAHLVLFVLFAAGLGGLAGRARPVAAFVGGWAVSYAALALSGSLASLLIDETVAGFGNDDIIDRLSLGAGGATPAAFWLGWVFGLAVLIGSFGKKQPKIVPTPATAPTPPVAAVPAPAPAAAPYGQWAPPPGPAAGGWGPQPDPTAVVPVVGAEPGATFPAPAPAAVPTPAGWPTGPDPAAPGPTPGAVPGPEAAPEPGWAPQPDPTAVPPAPEPVPEQPSPVPPAAPPSPAPVPGAPPRDDQPTQVITVPSSSEPTDTGSPSPDPTPAQAEPDIPEPPAGPPVIGPPPDRPQ